MDVVCVFVHGAAEIGPVPGNSGGLASRGTIHSPSVGQKCQKRCGIKTGLAQGGDIHQQRGPKMQRLGPLVNLHRCYCQTQKHDRLVPEIIIIAVITICKMNGIIGFVQNLTA